MPAHRLYPVIAAVLGCSLFALDAAAQDNPRRIGVVVSLTVSATQAEGRDLAAALGVALQKTLPVEVIAGHETERRLPPGGMPENCVAEAPCRVDLGRRLDADELLMLVIVRMGEQVHIDATWTDVASGRVASRPAMTLEPGQDPVEMFTGAGPALLPHIARRRSEPTGPRFIVVPPLAPTGSGRHVTPGTWMAVGVGAAALLGGTVFGLSARSKHDSLKDRGCETVMCPQSDIDRLRTHALTADVLLATALASGVVATVLYWRSAPAPAATTGAETGAPASPVTIHVSPDSVGVFVGGGF